MTQFRDPQQTETDIARSRVGALIDGRIRLEDLLGEGAGSYVYRAHHALLGKKVAVKILKAALANDPRSLNRFMQEARTANGITHRNIARVTAFGVFEQTPYLVMDLLEGRTLQDAFAAKNLDINEGIRLVMETADALAHLHANGLIHRDIKPSNIMLVVEDGKEHAKLLDLGIVKNFETNSMHEFQQLTQTGTLVGTPMYMSPEQCTGKALDQRSDIYSLGCVLFELVEGVAPFVGTNALETMFMHSNSPVPSLQCGSQELQAVISKCLQKQPELRYQTGAELIDALIGCPHQTIKTERQKRTGGNQLLSRKQAVMLGFTVCAIAGALAATVYIYQHGPKKQILPARSDYSGKNLVLPAVKSADDALAQLDHTGVDLTHPWQTDREVLKNCFALCEAGLEQDGSLAACCQLAESAAGLNYVLGESQGPGLSNETHAIAYGYANKYITQVLDSADKDKQIDPKVLDKMLEIVLPLLAVPGHWPRMAEYERILAHIPPNAAPTCEILQLHYDRGCRLEDGTAEQFSEFKYVWDNLRNTGIAPRSDLLEFYSKYLSSLEAVDEKDSSAREQQLLELYQALHKLKPTPQTFWQKRPNTNLYPKAWADRYCETALTLIELLASHPANNKFCVEAFAELPPIAQMTGNTILQERLQLGPPLGARAEHPPSADKASSAYSRHAEKPESAHQ